MMQHEFEELAGYEVSTEDYNNIIEPMYMATNLNKKEFVKCVDKKRFALKPIKNIIKEMKEIGEERKANCYRFYSRDAEERLDELTNEYIERRGLKGIAHYIIETESKYGCSYPKELNIYSASTYKTIETIKIA